MWHLHGCQPLWLLSSGVASDGGGLQEDWKLLYSFPLRLAVTPMSCVNMEDWHLKVIRQPILYVHWMGVECKMVQSLLKEPCCSNAYLSMWGPELFGSVKVSVDVCWENSDTKVDMFSSHSFLLQEMWKRLCNQWYPRPIPFAVVCWHEHLCSECYLESSYLTALFVEAETVALSFAWFVSSFCFKDTVILPYDFCMQDH